MPVECALLSKFYFLLVVSIKATSFSFIRYTSCARTITKCHQYSGWRLHGLGKQSLHCCTFCASNLYTLPSYKMLWGAMRQRAPFFLCNPRSHVEEPLGLHAFMPGTEREVTLTSCSLLVPHSIYFLAFSIADLDEPSFSKHIGDKTCVTICRQNRNVCLMKIYLAESLFYSTESLRCFFFDNFVCPCFV